MKPQLQPKLQRKSAHAPSNVAAAPRAECPSDCTQRDLNITNPNATCKPHRPMLKSDDDDDADDYDDDADEREREREREREAAL